MANVGRPPFELTQERYAKLIGAVRKGLNYTRAAYLVGCSRETLLKLRREHPTLDADMAAALSEWDMEQAEFQLAFLAVGNAQDSERVAKIRQNRLPQWYSPTQAMRVDREMQTDDEENAPTAASGVELGDAIVALLAAKKSGAL